MMRVRTPLIVAAIVALLFVPEAVRADPGNARAAQPALTVQAHPGAEAIDVSGYGASNQIVKITLLSTVSIDVPDAVLSRTVVNTNGDGLFTATISIAPGFTRGSIITVYAVPDGGSAAAKAQFDPDAPNRAVSIPLDQIPRSVR